ncbi:MAG: efflux RND transporter periplasmic adaptor subunit [Chitinophagales bacterium]
MSKGKWITLVLLLLLIGWLGSVKYKNIQKEKAKTMMQGKSKGMPSSIAVSGFVAEYTNLSNNLNTNGTIIASEEVQLQPEVSGRITYLNIPEGGVVGKGTLLAKINDAELQAQLKKLQSQYAIAASNESRLAQLLKINGVSQQEYDLALNTLQNVSADMELVKAQIDKTEIRAPFSGKLGLRNISMGAYVNPSTVITSLQSIQSMKLDVTVPEKYAGIIEVGNTMQCTVDGSTAPFSARVVAIEPQISETTRNLKVRAIVENAKSKLVAGAFVKVQIKLKQIANAIMIPGNAIIPDAQNKKVIIADSRKAKFVVVETGIRTENEVQIVSGIKVGDTIVTSGILQIKPGMGVKFTKTIGRTTIQ